MKRTKLEIHIFRDNNALFFKIPIQQKKRRNILNSEHSEIKFSEISFDDDGHFPFIILYNSFFLCSIIKI